MKKMLRCAGVHIYQMLVHPIFAILVLAVCLLMLTTEVHYYTLAGEEQKTILELIVFQGRSWLMENRPITVEELILQQPHRGLVDYIVILAALPFVNLFFKERASRVLRSRIQREGKIRFGLTRIFSGCIVGGLGVFLGAVLFLGIVSFFLPSTICDSGTWTEIYGEGNIHVLLVEHLAKFFFYGCLASLPSAVLAAFTRDIYLCLMIPFFICWILTIFQSYLISLLDLEHPEEKGTIWNILRWIREYGRMESVMQISLLQCFFVCAGGICIASILFQARLLTRRDQGA